MQGAPPEKGSLPPSEKGSCPSPVASKCLDLILGRFRWKIDKKSDALVHCIPVPENQWKCDAKIVSKLIWNLILFVFFLNRIQAFSKCWMCKKHCFYCVERMSPKKKEFEKRWKSEGEPSEKHTKKVSKKWRKTHRKFIEKTLKKREVKSWKNH